ncbi:MAG: cation-binding protein [Candidatus Omnitrophica bacterium CG11_big_fil_rev_8_21_14_0_20_42_13]|uniref:Cation-binding protein n=1 Tax=Candidatus Ghiorseimicrobium undicola TaxID=1974746 RepID=A0A2H0LYH9_9BACT|nr:MAG: cation-binding protein [Candidatus Omnitrophica bacterium CG11_big_fil_rev_8_21_14_0_20_42_13]
MIALLNKQARNLESGSEPDICFIEEAVDFIKTYADKCHHGKEEDILFRELAKKELSREHFRTRSELITEHKYARETLAALVDAKNVYGGGDKKAKKKIITYLKALVEFYPRHIEKEDKRFFLPVMDYFSRDEKDDMLNEFREFDRALIHEKYAAQVERMEKE